MKKPNIQNKFPHYQSPNNDEVSGNIKSLKKTKTVLEFILWIILIVWIYIFAGAANIFAQFNPKDVNNLSFFVESLELDTSQHIAHCETNFCLDHPNTEGAIITEQYCDVTSSCSEGCVRRWLDQSDYVPSGGFNPPEYTSGRNFGQDDSEKPCYISNCINGNPCIRGGGPYNSFTQDKYLEIQIPDFIYLTGEFSIFLLAKPIDQQVTGDWSYFGQSNSFLRHNVSSNNLQLRVPGNLVRTISADNSVNLDQWQIIEIHRNSSDLVTLFIDGIDSTRNSNITLPGTFQIGYLLSNFKTTGQFNQTGMYGDVAAFLVYDKKTTETETDNIRNYLDINYLSGTLNTSTNSLFEKLEVVPNVSNNQIRIINSNNNDINKILIYDQIGRLIQKIKVTDTGLETVIDVSNLKSGSYHLIIIDQNLEQIKRRFIKH